MNLRKALIVVTGIVVLLAGCGPKTPRFANGETVQYDVNGVTGTGVVVYSKPLLEDGKMVYYYSVDVGVDSTGKRDQPVLHEKLLKPARKR